MASYPVMWARRGFAARLLLPAAWLYGAVVAVRRRLYRAGWRKVERLPVAVVIVGNISVGGTGKTPLVLWLIRRLRDAGFVPGILSRGYGGSAAGPRAVSPNDDTAVCGDEPLLLARDSGAPVWTGSNRVAAGRALLAANPTCNVIVCDDGLQHYRLARDVEIAVVDGARGFGNGYVLPAGPLREPVRRLAQVDAVVVRGGAGAVAHGPVTITSPRYPMQLTPAAFVSVADPAQHTDAAFFRGKIVHAVAGIGNPQQFFDTLNGLGINHHPHPYPDHHAYTAADLAFAGAEAIVMTEKDAVKCASFAAAGPASKPDTRLWALRVTAEVDERLAQQVIERLHYIRRRDTA